MAHHPQRRDVPHPRPTGHQNDTEFKAVMRHLFDGHARFFTRDDARRQTLDSVQRFHDQVHREEDS